MCMSCRVGTTWVRTVHAHNFCVWSTLHMLRFRIFKEEIDLQLTCLHQLMTSLKLHSCVFHPGALNLIVKIKYNHVSQN